MRPTKTFDQERVSFNLARLKKAGSNYEVVIDPDNAIAFKEGKDLDLDEVLKAEQIFFDAKKGEHASEDRMEEIFGTTDTLKIATIILKEGEIQLTAEHRAKVREDKRKRVVQLIARNACDPKTKLPHPVTRIENAMVEAKVHIDEFKKPEDQLQDIIKHLRPVLPISIETRKATITVPAHYAGKTYGALQAYGTISQESWQDDGSWKGKLDVPAGMVNDLIDMLNNATQATAQVEFEEK